MRAAELDDAIGEVERCLHVAAEASSRLDARVGLSLLYMLLIPAFVPSTLAAYSGAIAVNCGVGGFDNR